MDEIKKIKRRIGNPNQAEKNGKHVVMRVLMTFLILTSLGIGFLIYAKADENGTFLNRIFHTNISFVEFNARVSNILNRMFNFNIFTKGGDQTVSANVNYISLGDDRYRCEDERVPMLKDGSISFIDEDEDGDFIVITYDNGVVGSYFGLTDTIVKVSDRLKAGDQIANYIDSFKVIFSKGTSVITYDEARL